MNLRKKKELIARTLNVGIGRVIIDGSMKDELKEAITRMDIKELEKQGIIKIKEMKGRKIKEKRKTRRKFGSIKKKVRNRKRDYIVLVRKLRAQIKSLLKRGAIDKEKYYELRRMARARTFKDLNHMKEYARTGGLK